MKTVLAFETSCPILSVALGTPQGKILEAKSPKPLRHSENLIPLMDQLLRKAKLKLEQIDAFAIDRGPGSFTGLRIGFGFLKGFLAAQKRPCYGAISLDMMADKISLPEESRLGILMDARREAVYVRIYLRREGTWKPESKLEVQSASDVKTKIKEGTVLAGSETLPSAATLVRWFQSKDPRISKLNSDEQIPLYLRVSEAEENRKRKLTARAR